MSLQNTPKRIFTFWEPADSMPAYIKLCIETWKRFLPEYEIIILDYSNLSEWIGSECYDGILYKEFSFPKIADAVRCAVLRQHGGIWLDTDTIIMSPNIEKLFSNGAELTLINRYISFLCAKPDARILKFWEKGVKTKLKLYNKFSLSPCYKFARVFRFGLAKRMQSWNFLGNSILNKYLVKAAPDKLITLCAEEIGVHPECTWQRENNIDLKNVKVYRQFYFYNDYSDFVLKHSSLIILLHNSWTPGVFQKMNKQEFLNTNTTLANLFRKLGIAE